MIGKLAVPEPDLMKWAQWTERSYIDRTHWVADEKIGGIRVSTIFLGLDHNHWRFSGGGGEHLPILFETMIQRGKKWDDQFRCETWEQAEAQHKAAVEQGRREIKEKVNE